MGWDNLQHDILEEFVSLSRGPYLLSLPEQASGYGLVEDIDKKKADSAQWRKDNKHVTESPAFKKRAIETTRAWRAKQKEDPETYAIWKAKQLVINRRSNARKKLDPDFRRKTNELRKARFEKARSAILAWVLSVETEFTLEMAASGAGMTSMKLTWEVVRNLKKTGQLVVVSDGVWRSAQ